MKVTLPSAAQVRASTHKLVDRDGRTYVRMSPNDASTLSLPSRQLWYWCARAPHGNRPRVGTVVHQYMVFTVALGFERTRAVGVVGLR